MKQANIANFDLYPGIIQNCSSSILIVDGLDSGNYKQLLSYLHNWLILNDSRRIIVISSLQVDIKEQNAERARIVRHAMPSWTLEEYLEALKDDNFFNSVNNSFSPADSREEMIYDKYFIAGGSARWMFSFTTDQAIADIDKNIKKVSNIQDLSAGFLGNRSLLAVNHLVMQLRLGNFFMSEFIARQVAEICEISFIQQAANCALAKTIPTFDGWVFEADFLLQIRLSETNQKPMVLRTSEKNIESLWNVNQRVHFLSVEKLSDCLCTVNTQEIGKFHLEDHNWLIPKKWNQGGYDAVQILPDGGVRFVQITRAKTHTLKLKYFEEMLDALVKLGFQVKSVQIAFVISNQGTFKLGKISEATGKYDNFLIESDNYIYSVYRMSRS